MVLKVYGERMSEPSRAVIIFCKVNRIEFEEIRTDILKNEQYSPEYKEINPMNQIPAIVDGDLKLFESHAILVYLSSAFPQVSSHWYPNDVYKRAKIHYVLDWHHSFLRRGAAGFVFNTLLAPLNSIRSYPQLLSEKDYDRILSPYVKVVQWVEDTKRSTAPHFEEVHGLLFESQKRIREQMATKSRKTKARSKM